MAPKTDQSQIPNMKHETHYINTLALKKNRPTRNPLPSIKLIHQSIIFAIFQWPFLATNLPASNGPSQDLHPPWSDSPQLSQKLTVLEDGQRQLLHRLQAALKHTEMEKQKGKEREGNHWNHHDTPSIAF